MTRNAKGHFVKRSRTTRRSRRRNPSGFIKVGRRWKKITKFAKRRRRGSRRGQIRAFKFPRRYRRSRRRVHRNPVVVSNPRRSRRRVRRNPHRSHRRYARRNPSVAMRLSSDPIGAIKNAIMSAFSMDTVETLAHMGLGFGGSLWLGKLLYQQPWVPVTLGVPVTKVASTFVSTVALTALSSFLKSPKLTARMLTGGLFATLWSAVSEAARGTTVEQFIPTLSGTDDTFRKAIEAEVLKELRGGGVNGYLPAAGAEGYSTYLRPAGIEYLRPAGQEAYLTRTNTERANEAAGMSAFLTERESMRVDARPSGVGDDAGEFGGRDLPERF
jgi:hypothetical protein